MKATTSLLVLIVLLVVSCRRPETASRRVVPVERAQAVMIAKKSAAEAFERLSGELATAISEGGVAAAVTVCSERAPDILTKIENEKHLGISRWTDRPRNANHLAGKTDALVITGFREAMAAGKPLEPDVREGAKSEVEVRLPIVLNHPLCLQCHGSPSDVETETRKAILSIYPEDRATGYRLNDLRGIWKITIPPVREP